MSEQVSFLIGEYHTGTIRKITIKWLDGKMIGWALA
jgi:hypothetical protein